MPSNNRYPVEQLRIRSMEIFNGFDFNIFNESIEDEFPRVKPAGKETRAESSLLFWILV